MTNQLLVNPLPSATPSAGPEPKEDPPEEKLSMGASLGVGVAVGAVGVLGIAATVSHFMRHRGYTQVGERAPLM
jgi:hypothetical protein